jgi:anti-sigma-K factor RskA
MSDTTDHHERPDDDMLAAEYVLGVLSADERAAAARRIERDMVFAHLVAGWESRLMPWAETVAPVAPPPEMWNRIAAELPAQRGAGSWWDSLAFWRPLAFGAGGVALASLVALFFVVSQPAAPPLIAAIEGGGHRHFVVTLDAAHRTLAAVPAAFSADATRVPELWIIPPDGKPRSLGLLRADRAVTLTLPADLAGFARAGVALAVSLEPAGGSPTGAPTGPVVAQGKLASL